MLDEQIKRYCKNCKTERPCTTKAGKATAVCYSEEITYTKITLHCCTCGCEVEDDYFEKKNNIEINNECYRKTGLISPLGIGEILNKYGIGKRAMSLLLGWGEHTLSRYLDGQKPPRDRSDTLRLIAFNPEHLRTIASKEEIKDKFSDPTTYYNFMHRIEELCNPFTESIPRDILDAFLYISRAFFDDIRPDDINRALYFYFGLRFALYGEKLDDVIPCCSDEPSDSWFYISNVLYGDDNYQRFFESYDVKLSARNKLLLDNLIRYFLCYSTGTLKKIVDKNIAALNLSSSEDSVYINNESVYDHFSAIKEKYKMLTPSDIRFYAEDLFRSVV